MSHAYARTDCEFESDGFRCGAWLYRPQGVPAPPVIVMAHGFGAERTFGLEPFAMRFARDGFAVLLFDHRGFGDSDGPVRGLVDPFRQLDDWRAAIRHVRERDDVDGDRLALWGTSFSGGHVISLAAEDPGIGAIVAQVPFVDPISTARMLGTRAVLRMLMAAGWDTVRRVVTRTPHCIPVAGAPGTTACLTTSDSLEGYASIVGDSLWENRVAARSALAFARYRPMWRTRAVRCPAFVALAEHDTLIAPDVVERAARKMDAELHRVPCGHFDVYHGEHADELADRQSEFLRGTLGAVSGIDWWQRAA